MKSLEKDDLVTWLRDVSQVSGVETIVLKQEHHFIKTFTEQMMFFMLLCTLTLAASAPYYLNPGTDNDSGGFKTSGLVGNTVAFDEQLNDVEVAVVEETTTSTTTTTTTTTSSTTTTSTTTTSTTTTTQECGGDWEPPCETEEGPKCDPLLRVGADDICHTRSCVPGVDSGRPEGKCGTFAEGYCQSAAE